MDKTGKKGRKATISVRYRLIIAIPAILTLFVIASAVLALNLAQSFYTLPGGQLRQGAGQLTSSWVMIWVFGFALFSLFCGLLLAYGITSPLRRLAEKAESFGRGESDVLARRKPPENELKWLAEAFQNAFASMDAYIRDSSILDSLPSAVVTIDKKGRVSGMNRVAERLLGCDEASMVGRSYAKRLFRADGDGQRVLEMIEEALIEGRSFSSEEVLIVTPDRRRIDAGVSISPIGEGPNRPSGVIVTFKDLGDVKKIREQIQRLDQLAAIGSLTAGIAHEIRNPLGSIRGLAEMILEETQEEDSKKLYLERMLKTIDRLDRLVEDLLTYANPGVSELAAHDLNDVLREAVALLNSEQTQKRFDIITEFEPDLPSAMIDPERMTQAILNLLINAADAVPEGGRIKISSSATSGTAGIELVVEVHNTGSYIPEEERDKIFLPMYTTKKKGSGLGLAIVQQIIAAHSGVIDLQSDPNDGTTFAIRLPAAALSASQNRSAEGGGERP